MPYLPPGSSQPQPIPHARQRTVISPPPPPPSQPAPPPIDDIPTPRASDIYPTPRSEHNPAMPASSPSPHPSPSPPSPPAPIPVSRTSVTSPEDILSSALAATSLDSTTSAVSAGTSSSPPSLCDSQGHPSPAATSVRSLPSDREDRGGAGGADEDEDQEDGIKVAGERMRDAESASPDVDVEAAKAAVREPPGEKDAVSLYSDAIYAYTHTLYIQAKLSSSRTERRKQASQYAPKASGMEKMAAKKALALRLNG